MFVRLKAMKKISTKQYRLTLDVVDHEREHWDYGDCQLQVDLWDEPAHRAQMRGPLATAFDLYQLAPKDPPTGTSPSSRSCSCGRRCARTSRRWPPKERATSSTSTWSASLAGASPTARFR